MILIIFVSFIFFLLFKVPVAGALGLSIILGTIYAGQPTLEFLARTLVQSMDSFPILAIPLFILAGEIMGQGGISKRLFDFAQALMGKVTGGIPMATVVTSMLFGAISGSGNATFAAIGGMAIPAMSKQGYKKTFTTPLLAASGGIGVIIPPSIPMVMFGIAAGVSIGDMFLAGIIPGIIVGLCLMLYAYIYCKVKKITIAEDQMIKKSILRTINEGKWALLTPVIILGGIYGGIFTPTEAAGIAVLYSLIISLFVYRTLTFKELPAILLRTVSIVSPILLIVAVATVFGRVMTMQGIPTMMANAIISVSDSPFIIMLLLNLFLLFIGMFMETLAAIIILAPILLPIAEGIGLDPIHFGIIMIANLAIGLVTPPVGTNLYLGSSMSNIPIKELSKLIVGPLIFLLISLLVINLFPQLSLFIPQLSK